MQRIAAPSNLLRVRPAPRRHVYGFTNMGSTYHRIIIRDREDVSQGSPQGELMLTSRA